MRKGFISIGYTDQDYRPAHQSAHRIAYDVLGLEKKCELCGSMKSIDVHHKDHDYKNNTPENIMVLCRSCHMKIHRDYGKSLSH